jgi:hypothetical protein
LLNCERPLKFPPESEILMAPVKGNLEKFRKNRHQLPRITVPDMPAFLLFLIIRNLVNLVICLEFEYFTSYILESDSSPINLFQMFLLSTWI